MSDQKLKGERIAKRLSRAGVCSRREAERWIDDDHEMISQFYTAKRMYPDIPFYLQDENGDNYVFGWDLICLLYTSPSPRD